MTNVFSIAEILIAHALRAHPGEIAIVAYYGSHAKGTASSTSDLDIFFIPDEGKAQSLSSQFILDGLPYDFWPVSWSYLEGIADARPGRPWPVAASLVADARLLYHRSQEDLDRFNALQARIAELTRPDKLATMVERSLEEFKNTLFQLGQMRLEGAGPQDTLPAVYESPLFRIIQEGLNNIGQHAAASSVLVRLTVDEAGGVVVSVRDDGRGFDPSLLGPTDQAGDHVVV